MVRQDRSNQIRIDRHGGLLVINAKKPGIYCTSIPMMRNLIRWKIKFLYVLTKEENDKIIKAYKERKKLKDEEKKKYEARFDD